jgi:hypothetical protein
MQCKTNIVGAETVDSIKDVHMLLLSFFTSSLTLNKDASKNIKGLITILISYFAFFTVLIPLF